ncbi:DoxX family protein [Psychrobacter sp. FDAARGOS_221]|uniref:DoxX family protein n=1 Tax=Psychrobacter sp. FDAARGOS_221 TaxID=1975705 RepID=UPI000BB54C20|nr:DoxX family protein [Psychrobacter sp. FDAARGOS_221]PNK60671.1 DoxX family protein [Psychrobacter sp. FDAARGOS_221]
MDKFYDISAPIGRFLLTAIFIYSGLGKISSYAATQGYMEAMNIPGFILPLVIILEVFGGLAVLVGFKARAIAFLLAGFSILSAIIFHPFSDPEQQNHFLKNIAMAGGFLMIVAHGPGPLSFDARHK